MSREFLRDLQMEDIKVGDEFATFEELQSKIENYSKGNYVQLWVRESRKIAAAKKHAPKKAEKVKDDLQYFSIKYCCIHGGMTFRAQGQGLRETKTYKKGCPFFIALRASEDGQHLVIRAMERQHLNHEMSEALYRHLPHQRKLSEEDKKKAASLLHMRANKQIVQSRMEQETGKVITLRDLSNIAARSKTSSRNDLEAFVDTLKEKYHADVQLMTDESHTLKGVYFQDKDMKRTYDAFPEFICMDAIYKLLETRFTVFILMCEDGEGQSEVVAVGLLADEEAATLRWFLGCFKDNNPKWLETTVFMTDKDLTERSVIRTLFPDAALLICRFHSLRTFNRELTSAKMGITAAQRTVALENIQKLVYCTSDEQYNELYDAFIQSVPFTVATYYNANWHPIRSEWVLGLKFAVNSFMNTTNNRLERLNGQLKEVVQYYSSLEDFLQSFYIVLGSLRNEHDHKVAVQFHKSKVTTFSSTSSESRYNNILTGYAGQFVVKQLQLSVAMVELLQESTPERYSWQSREGLLSVTASSCDCVFRKSMGLPCRHIFATRRLLNEDLFEPSLCKKRWLLSTSKETQRLFQQHVSGPEEQTTVSVVEAANPRRNKLSYNQKFSIAMKRFRKMAERMAEVGTDSFNKRLEQLEKLEVEWQGEDISSNGSAMGFLSLVDDSSGTRPTSRLVADDSSGTRPTSRLVADVSSGTRATSPLVDDNNAIEVVTENAPDQQVTVNIREIKIPLLIKKRGRPKGRDVTTIGLTRKKQRTTT